MMSRWETTTQKLDQMGVHQDTEVWEDTGGRGCRAQTPDHAP